MTKDQAITEAKATANEFDIDMVVTFNPYEETLDEADKFGYFPAGATHIFKYEEVVETIKPGDTV